VKVWEEVAKIRPQDALPHQRLAGLYSALKDHKNEIEQFEILAKVELKDNRFAKRIARLYRDDQDWKNAGKYALDAVYINPYDISAHEVLAEVCEKTGDEKGLAREKRVIGDLTKLKEEQDKADSLGN